MDMKTVHHKIKLSLKHLDSIPEGYLGDLDKLITSAADTLDEAEEIARDLAKDE